MNDGVSQRKFPRRPVTENIYSYVDGVRLDASSANVSVGGMFLRTRSYQKVPIGSLISVVFQSAMAARYKIYLVARVVRTQEEPIAGLGLKWERAYTKDAAKPLAHFLQRLLGIRSTVIEEQIRLDAAVSRFVYVFGAQPGGQDRATEDAAEGRSPGDSTDVGASEVDEVRVVQVAAAETPPVGTLCAPIIVPDIEADRGPGAMTQELSLHSLRAPTNLPARATFGDGQAKAVTINALGVTSLTLCADAPISGPFGTIPVSFDIPHVGKPVAVGVDGTLTGIDLPRGGQFLTIEIDIDKVDEGRSPGVFAAFVRWLHSRDVAGV